MTDKHTADQAKNWRTRTPAVATPSSYFPRRGSGTDDREQKTVISYRMSPDELARLARVGQMFNLNMSASMRVALSRGLDVIEQESKNGKGSK
jgi:post-segregation antitoxin (ccd killing protein)